MQKNFKKRYSIFLFGLSILLIGCLIFSDTIISSVLQTRSSISGYLYEIGQALNTPSSNTTVSIVIIIAGVCFTFLAVNNKFWKE